MLLVLQFPISDARSFDPDPDLRLALPDWSSLGTQANRQFVNRFGPAVQRRQEPDLAWPDEISFCRASRALRFDELERRRAGPPEATFRPQCAFRRLFFDGRTVARVEIGIRHHSKVPPLVELDGQKVLAIANALCEIPTAVPQAGKPPIEAAMLRQGPALARLFALSSIGKAMAEKKARAEDLVQAGNPLLLVDIEPGEAPESLVPPGFEAVPAVAAGAHLAFGRLRVGRSVVPTWICQAAPGPDPGLKDLVLKHSQSHRNLRLCLLRLHAEQESLDWVLKQILRHRLLDEPAAPEDGQRSAVVDRFDAYFNEKTKLINRDEWGGVKQSAILSAFDAAEQVTLPTSRQNLFNRYDGARQQVWKKVEEYQVRRASVRTVNVAYVNPGGTYVVKNISVNVPGSGNVVNVAEYMSNVTNTVTSNLGNSTASEDVKALVKEMTEQITAIAQKIDPKQAQRMGQDVETLSKEMSQPEPRRKWYEVSLEGLKEAAEAVGGIAAPIVATVKKLLPLLVGA